MIEGDECSGGTADPARGSIRVELGKRKSGKCCICFQPFFLNSGGEIPKHPKLPIGVDPPTEPRYF